MTQQQQAVGTNVLVYAYQYFPGSPFEVVTEIDDAEQILTVEGDLQVVANPGEYDGFIIRYQFSEVPFHGILFVPQDANVNEDDSFMLQQTASFISAEANLLQTRLDAAEGTGQMEAETPTPTEGA